MTDRILSLAWQAAGALFLAGCTASGPSGHHDRASPASASAEAPLRMVAEGLFASGQPAPGQWTSIRTQGITTVINLRPDAEMAGRDEAAEVAAAGMAYRQLDIGGSEDITGENAARIQAWIDEAPGAVLLHCASGNRVGALLAVIAARNGTPPAEALELGRSAGLTSLEPAVRAVIGPATTDP